MCPPATCLATCSAAACAGHQFVLKGVARCVNTTAPVGTAYIVTFLACDS